MAATVTAGLAFDEGKLTTRTGNVFNEHSSFNFYIYIFSSRQTNDAKMRVVHAHNVMLLLVFRSNLEP